MHTHSHDTLKWLICRMFSNNRKEKETFSKYAAKLIVWYAVLNCCKTLTQWLNKSEEFTNNSPFRKRKQLRSSILIIYFTLQNLLNKALVLINIGSQHSQGITTDQIERICNKKKSILQKRQENKSLYGKLYKFSAQKVKFS